MEAEAQAGSGNQAPPIELIPPGGVLYKVDSSRASFAELWRDTRSPLVLAAWLTKLLRIRLPGSVNDPNVESMRPFQIPYATLPAELRARLEPKLMELAAFGFEVRQPVAHRIVDLFNNSHAHWVTVPRVDGGAVARICLRTEGTRVPPKTHFYLEMISERAGGTFLQTSGARASMDAPASVTVKRLPVGTPSQILASHQEQIQKSAMPIILLQPGDTEGMLRMIDRHHAVTRDLHLRRGVFKAMSELDQKNSSALNASYARASDSAATFPEVMIEMERLQAGKTGWVGGLTILAISVILFAIAGAPGKSAAPAERSWEWIGLLLPILFFHELGHFIAMRVFKYRNVRMFFIPMFGAAVSGQNYGAPGWKKVIVSLMGPLPGILVGAILGIAGVVLHHALLVKIALFALVLNGFNLLPVLPFDGGRVVQNLLFCRHYALDVAFRIITSLILIGGGLWSGEKILGFLGFFMLMGIPLALRNGRTAAELRRAGFGPPPGDATTIPPAVAQEIIGRVSARFANKKTRNNKIIAQQSLAVYETLCATPPGWLATFGFGALHFGGFAAAVVFAVMLSVANGGRLPNFSRLNKPVVKYAISAADLPRVTGEDSGGEPIVAGLSPVTIIANYPTAPAARKEFGALRRQLAPREVLQCFGNTLLLSLPGTDDAARGRWITILERQTTEVCVNTNDDMGLGGAHLVLTCNLPDVASARFLREELDEYLTIPGGMNLIAPWSPMMPTSPTELAQYRVARRTYKRLQQVANEAFADPHRDAIQKQFAEAARRGDKAEIKRLGRQQAVILKNAQEQGYRHLRATADGTVDTALVDLYVKLHSHDADDEAVPGDVYNFASAPNQAMAARMGQVKMAQGKPAPPGNLSGTTFGSAQQDGRQLTLNWLGFVDPATGAPELVRWLATRGATSMKYDFTIPSRRALEE